MLKNNELDKVLNDYINFLADFKTVILATTNQTNIPEASYAPYIYLEGKYYLFISELAVHTQNLLHTPRCSLLFIEDESKSKNLFARQRVSLQCTADEVRDSNQYPLVLNLFHERFGKFMQLLQTLPDFHLFCLSPESGNYVAGFGKAYTLAGTDLQQLQHRNPEAGNVRPS